MSDLTPLTDSPMQAPANKVMDKSRGGMCTFQKNKNAEVH